MKKYILTFAVVFLGLLFSSPAFASEKINNFEMNARINEDSSIDITEKITYDFGLEQKHGIFRTIPIKYDARGGKYNLRVSDVSVKDENGINYNFTTSFPDKNIEIKIGDADRLVTGIKIYVVSYRINRAINYFNDHDEFYWNVTGNDWTVAIEKASARISLYNNSKENLKTACYSGYYASTYNCNISNNELFQSQNLNPREGMTVVFGFPKEIIQKPTAWQETLSIISDNKIVFLPLFVFIILFVIWYRYGKDPKGKGTIITQFDVPDNLTPAEVGVIMDNEVGNNDISANIVNLAVKGYIKINRIEKKGFLGTEDYLLEKLKPEDDLPNDFEKEIMKGLFGRPKIDTESEERKKAIKKGEPLDSVKISELKTKLYEKIRKIIETIYEVVVSKGYYKKNPNSLRGTYVVVALISSGLAIFFFRNFLGLYGVFSVIASSILIIVFSFLMPVRTLKGVLTKEYLLGLKRYMSVAEKDRINFHNAPEKNPQHFEKLLPYAMVFGVEKEWAKQFEGIYDKQPSWYSDPSGATFNAVFFADSIGHFSKTANSIASAPSSASGGGSGFSGGGVGGGFGGGGGGSW